MICCLINEQYCNNLRKGIGLMLYKVSVIIPIYKVLPFIDECINSVLQQTYDNIEIILVDDGSPDECGKICDKYQKIDKRVKTIHQENGGLSAARNAGLDIATGDFILFVDGDDLIVPNAIEWLIECQRNSDADIVQGRFFRDKKELETVHSEIELFSGRDFLLSAYFRTEACINLYRSTCFINMRFPIGILHEDVALIYKIVYKAKRVAYTNVKFYYYRQRSNSIMTKDFDKKNLIIIDLIEEQICFYRSHNEKELLDKAYYSYYSVLLDCAWKVKKLPDGKKIKKQIINKYRCNYINFIKIGFLRFRTKFLLTITFLVPNIWKYSEKMLTILSKV